jgi:2-iminobutanoate/2-iminopropanoate deaminase
MFDNDKETEAMERVNPEESWKPAGFVHATTNGTILITSGQTGRDANGQIVSDSFVPQARQAFQNIRNIVESVGRTMDDVMKLTVYVTDLRYGEDYVKVKGEFFRPEKLPASTFVGTTGLWDKRQLIEIEAVVDMSEKSA